MSEALKTHTNTKEVTGKLTNSANNSSVPIRPIQYLGSKLRMLDKIVSASDFLVGKGAPVADVFTGTSVVAQSLAQNGFQVSAVDTEKYAYIFSTALLGVGREKGNNAEIAMISSRTYEEVLGKGVHKWQTLAIQEAQYIDSDDTDNLKKLYASIPLLWRDKQSPLFKYVSSTNNPVAYGRVPLLTAIYSGTYFGIHQALELDYYLQSAERLKFQGKISTWQHAAFQTAIMSAASAIVHSAGKHFAQPLAGKKTGNENFKNKRLVADRSISVLKIIEKCLSQINSIPVNHMNGHAAIQSTAESYISKPPVQNELYYLDPPYTAQQYSRFYHILDIMCSYRFPHLLNDGKITQGLYTKERFKSDFCSKRKAIFAMTSIVNNAYQQNASLLISYSQSKVGSVGNERMITLEKLLSVCVEFYGISSVESSEEKHSYRQFNSKVNANLYRNDPEVMILCKRR